MSSPLRAYRPDPGQPFRIGRSDSCDLVLHDPAVSRQHASIYRKDTGEWCFENQSATSGTWCGEEKITLHTLHDGDILQAGVQQLRFVIQGEELTLLHIAPSESNAPIAVPSSGSLTLGRHPACSIVIPHPQCPALLAQATLLGDDCKLRFRVPTHDAQGRRRRKVLLRPGNWIDLPWGTLRFQNQELEWHPRTAGLALSLQDLRIDKNKRTLLQGLGFDLEPGQLLSVIGLSGQGKSTLLHALAKSSPPTHGTISLDERPHHHRDLQARVAFLPQEPLLRDFLTVQETLREAARLKLPADHKAHEVEERIQGLLSLVSLEHRAETRTQVLSGGERRRLALAAQLMGSPGLLLLDEPLSGLDPVNAAKLCTHLRQLAWLGHTIVLTTHSYAALEISDRVLVLHEGYQAFFGNRDEAFQFFNTTSTESLLGKLPHKNGSEWSTQYRRSRFEQTRLATRPQPQSAPTLLLASRAPRSAPLGRHLRLEWLQWTRDHGRAAAVLLQPILIGLLLRQVFQPGASLWAAAFALLLCANWFALSLSIRSIVAERALLADEARTDSSSFSLLISKSLFPLTLALLQSLTCWLLFGPALNSHPPLFWLLPVLGTTLLPAVATGIATSSLCRTTGQANALLPLLIIPQVALAGALAPLDQMSLLGRTLSQSLWSSHTQTLLQNLLTAQPMAITSFAIPAGIATGIFIIDGYLLARLRKNT